MNQMAPKSSSAALKALGREKLLGRLGVVVPAQLLVFLITISLNTTATLSTNLNSIGSMLLYFLTSIVISLLSGFLTVGFTFMMLKLHCGQSITISDLFYGFHFGSGKITALVFLLSIITELLMLPVTIFSTLYSTTGHAVYLMLTCIFCVVCGILLIIFELTYSQVYYLMLDFPNYTVSELMRGSSQLMKGSKGRLFYIHVSFLPLLLLGFFSCGIAYLWLTPYIRSTCTAFYLDLMRK